MNAFDQYEVWFVTGAQLLYGGDAVIAVDAHSNEMVAGLRLSKLLTMMRNVSVLSLGCTLSLLPRCGFTVCRN